MTLTEIKALFAEVIEEKAIYQKLEGISEDTVYNWRKGRGKKPPTTGQMLDVLWQLGKIKISHEPTAKP